jgi:hypothetical protein
VAGIAVVDLSRRCRGGGMTGTVIRLLRPAAAPGRVERPRPLPSRFLRLAGSLRGLLAMNRAAPPPSRSPSTALHSMTVRQPCRSRISMPSAPALCGIDCRKRPNRNFPRASAPVRRLAVWSTCRHGAGTRPVPGGKTERRWPGHVLPTESRIEGLTRAIDGS